MSPETVRGEGLLLIPDAHLAATPPGQRLPGYTEQVLSKVRACLERARVLGLVPVFLGDLFHWPRENSNSLLVDLMELFRPHRPWVLVGNHDKYQACYTTDVSLAVLETAGVCRVISERGVAFVLEAPSGRVDVGASPDGTRIPDCHERNGAGTVVWLTHHNVNFPDFPDKRERVREIPGVDWVLNGHIHRPQPLQTAGTTRWANPGNIVRLTFSRRSLEREPAASIWRPGCEDLEQWVVPHQDFYDVFPRQEFPALEEEGGGDESRFLQGLERLRWRRTREGVGLRVFLNDNLDMELPESRLIMDLYEEVVGGREE